MENLGENFKNFMKITKNSEKKLRQTIEISRNFEIKKHKIHKKKNLKNPKVSKKNSMNNKISRNFKRKTPEKVRNFEKHKISFMKIAKISKNPI